MWNETEYKKPPENITVKTRIYDDKGERNVQDLIYYKKLWWDKDKKMYVYYTPTHWKFK
jgi:hypothetical protein